MLVENELRVEGRLVDVDRRCLSSVDEVPENEDRVDPVVREVVAIGKDLDEVDPRPVRDVRRLECAAAGARKTGLSMI